MRPGMAIPVGQDARPRIYHAVRRIPRGRVATYGQVAALAGMPGHARQVGYALHALEAGSRVPWHRVVNARGRISFPPESMDWAVQRALLEGEGVCLGTGGVIPLARFQWRPRLGRAERSKPLAVL